MVQGRGESSPLSPLLEDGLMDKWCRPRHGAHPPHHSQLVLVLCAGAGSIPAAILSWETKEQSVLVIAELSLLQE